MTTLESFRLFLDAIKRERTTTVNIDYWNRLMNSEMRNWLKAKAPAGELVQDRIDDLEQLRVATDGETLFAGNKLMPINRIEYFTTWPQFYLPVHYDEQNHPLTHYPEYFRLLSVMFHVWYDPLSKEKRSSEDWVQAKILRSDKRAVMSTNYYRRPTKDRIYYEIVNDVIRVVADRKLIDPYLMRLEYYRYPNRIWLDETNPKDHTNETASPYTPGYGSVPCELGDAQTEEIINLAARTHLERNSDQRLGTFSQQLSQKQ